MFRNFATAGLMATFCSAALIAQTPTTGASPQTPPAQPGAVAPSDQQRTTTTSQQGMSVTLVGCLQKEENVQGRQPNIAERAGILEDYILTSAQMASSAGSTPGASGATGTSGTAGATAGTSGSTAAAGTAAGASANISSKYKLEGIADEKLSSLVGKRVEVSGRIDADDAREVAGSGAAGTSGSAAATPRDADDDMPEFEAVSIREVPGTCDK
jgi:hypothetical protein